MMTLELANLKLHDLYKKSLDNNTVPSFKLGKENGSWDVVVSDVVPVVMKKSKINGEER